MTDTVCQEYKNSTNINVLYSNCYPDYIFNTTKIFFFFNPKPVSLQFIEDHGL